MLVILPSPHPRAPTRPSTSKVLRVGERAQFFILLLFSPCDSHLSLSKSLGARQIESNYALTNLLFGL
jgi:hypothetical protein